MAVLSLAVLREYSAMMSQVLALEQFVEHVLQDFPKSIRNVLVRAYSFLI